MGVYLFVLDLKRSEKQVKDTRRNDENYQWAAKLRAHRPREIVRDNNFREHGDV